MVVNTVVLQSDAMATIYFTISLVVSVQLIFKGGISLKLPDIYTGWIGYV